MTANDFVKQYKKIKIKQYGTPTVKARKISKEYPDCRILKKNIMLIYDKKDPNGFSFYVKLNENNELHWMNQSKTSGKWVLWGLVQIER